MLSKYRISNIVLANSRNYRTIGYRISDQGLNVSDYRISDSEKTIGLPTSGSYKRFLSENEPIVKKQFQRKEGVELRRCRAAVQSTCRICPSHKHFPPTPRFVHRDHTPL